MEVSSAVTERIFATSSNEIDTVHEEEAERILGLCSPFYEEWLIAKCGALNDKQDKVIKSISAMRLAMFILNAQNDDSIPKGPEFGNNLDSIVKDATLAIEMSKAGLLAPYVESMETRNSCIEKAENEHIFAFHDGLKKWMKEAKEQTSNTN